MSSLIHHMKLQLSNTQSIKKIKANHQPILTDFFAFNDQDRAFLSLSFFSWLDVHALERLLCLEISIICVKSWSKKAIEFYLSNISLFSILLKFIFFELHKICIIIRKKMIVTWWIFLLEGVYDLVGSVNCKCLRVLLCTFSWK